MKNEDELADERIELINCLKAFCAVLSNINVEDCDVIETATDNFFVSMTVERIPEAKH